MFITAPLLDQLRHLTGDPDRAEGLAAALSELCVDVEVTVPSWVSVSIVLTSSTDADVEVAMVAPGGQDGARVRSSLAVPLSEIDPAPQLIIRARAADALLLVADDLASRLGRARPIIRDRHLDPSPSREAAAAVFADRGSVDQAIGVLLDRGLSPPQARQDLQRRAYAAGVSLAAAARSLLATLPRSGNPGPRGQ